MTATGVGVARKINRIIGAATGERGCGQKRDDKERGEVAHLKEQVSWAQAASGARVEELRVFT